MTFVNMLCMNLRCLHEININLYPFQSFLKLLSIHTCTMYNVHVHVHVHVYMYTCIHVHVHVYMYVHLFISTERVHT